MGPSIAQLLGRSRWDKETMIRRKKDLSDPSVQSYRVRRHIGHFRLIAYNPGRAALLILHRWREKGSGPFPSSSRQTDFRVMDHQGQEAHQSEARIVQVRMQYDHRRERDTRIQKIRENSCKKKPWPRIAVLTGKILCLVIPWSSFELL